MQAIPIPGRAPELDVAIEAAVRAGEAILEAYRGGFESHKKSDGSPVTDADLKSNHIIKEILGQTGRAILSEEDADDRSRLSSGTVWIVDPLDGTSDFVDRTGEFTVMIALVQDGSPVLGVIGWPAEGELFAAQSGRGAFRWSGAWSRISVTQTADLARCRAVGSRHHLSDTDRSFIGSLGMESFASVGSSLKVARISSGEAEAYITTTDKMKEWDTAASYCIVTEAGGRMTDMRGGGLGYNRADVVHHDGILVTNGAIHDRIVSEFKKIC
ncbi:MAG: 3'(2'),5'-bisphosphate nucleotidase CysQ [Nitrosopumilus sp. H13]|nr:MAG: 3'(2'),5'-bisphosphate nucleotidase CysQ [Nitrosopumilus sp. H13]